MLVATTVNKMVDENNQERSGLLAVFDTATLKKAEEFVERAALEDEEEKARHEEQLSPKERMQRSVKAIQFIHRLGGAAQERDTVDGLMLEVSEAVAQHWLDVRWHYVAVVMGYTTAAFLFAGFIVGAQDVV